jgi:DNA-binding beta-propeller fold protein YncE
MQWAEVRLALPLRVIAFGSPTFSARVLPKLRAADGFNLGTFKTGDGASGIVFDGTFIWVVNNGDSTVVKMTAEGAIVTTYATGKGPFAVAFDGSKIWVSNFASDSVSTTAAN